MNYLKNQKKKEKQKTLEYVDLGKESSRERLGVANGKCDRQCTSHELPMVV